MRLTIVYSFILLFITFCNNHSVAQSLKRSVISATGGSFSNPQVRVASTVGQPPNPGTVQASNGVYLRQGFQQPPENSSGTDDDCLFTASFDMTSEDLGECGTQYSFTYTGSSDPNLQYLWDFGAGALPPTSTSMNPTGVVYANTGLKTIVLYVTLDSCTEDASRIIDVTDVGFGALSVVSDVQCFGDGNGSIELEVFNGETPYQYQWNIPSLSGAAITGLAAGEYAYTVTDANGCIFESADEVGGPDRGLEVDIIYLDESCTGTEDGEITLSVSGGTPPFIYQWENGSTTNALTGLSAGSYSLKIIDDNNCQLDTTITLIVFCEDGDDSIPDVFTPNGDGKNDVWIIPGIENYPNNEVFIYSRWGEAVYTMKSYMNTWTGTNQDGDPLAVGAYFYLILLNDEFDTKFSGSITIIR